MTYTPEQLNYMISFIFLFCVYATIYFSARFGLWFSRHIYNFSHCVYLFITSYINECKASGQYRNIFRYLVEYLTDERCPYFESWRSHDN